MGLMGMMTLGAALACAGAAGTGPHDMSAAEHDQAAREHEGTGAEHTAEFKPAGRDATDENDCAKYLGSCWASNPTEQHRDEAREHRSLAAKHRAASGALRTAEASACVGLSDADRDVSPFVQREAIARVAPLMQTENVGYGESVESRTEQVGATIILRAAVGLTAERLQRVVTCHAARAASLGHDAPEFSFCPLGVKGVSASVRSTGDAFAVNVSADSRDGAAEVLARAQRLVTAKPSVQAIPARP
jgi:hypothetical protein